VAGALLFFARRRWAGVGLALLVEATILLPLAYADPATVVGIPAAVAAAIGGTVAVVFGPLDGALVALVGAALFILLGGWGAGELMALGVWPAVVVAAGLFARRVERQRRAFAQLMAEHETERQRIALELHDETAQALAAALLALKHAEAAATADEWGAAHREIRRLIQETITNLRELAVELRPKALDDFGLDPALHRLAASTAERTGVAIRVDVGPGDDRLAPETEIAAYRAVQDVLGRLVAANGGGRIRVAVTRTEVVLRIVIEHDEPVPPRPPVSRRPPDLEGLRERVRLSGGRVVATSGAAGTTVQVELPL